MKMDHIANEPVSPPVASAAEILSPAGTFRHNPATMAQNRCTSVFLSIAVILDVVGLLLLLIGIFAPLSFWDFFVLSGPLLIFLSLILWIFWYLGNLTVSEDELDLHIRNIL